MDNTALITGAAGFIGFHLSKKLLKNGYKVIGLDNLNSYYDKTLKQKRLEILEEEYSSKKNNWKFIETDLINKNALIRMFETYKPLIVINLAAQAGVRYSIDNPDTYVNSNIVGFLNILECCRTFPISNLLYASSSSVYGGNTKIPFSELDSVNHPISLYAATKRSNELMAHTYSHLFKIPSIGMRFFTVYGPWGRPDMAPMLFADAILKNKPIEIFNFGNMSRSFTYIDDVIEIIFKLIKKPAKPDNFFKSKEPNPSTSWCAHRIFNIGNENSTTLIDFITSLEKELGTKAIKRYKSMQPGDVVDTLADNIMLKDWIGNYETTTLEEGIKKFVLWFKNYQ